MYAVLQRVKIKPGQDAAIRSSVTENGEAILGSLAGADQVTWFRNPADEGEIQQALWLFDTEGEARQASVAFEGLREMPDAPSEFLSSDVCEVIGHEIVDDTPVPPPMPSGGPPMPSGGPAMTQWEYAWVHQVSSANPTKALNKVMDAATKLGGAGWEMVNHTTVIDTQTGLTMVKYWHVTAMFKRPR